jgi:hypothetical protein
MNTSKVTAPISDIMGLVTMVIGWALILLIGVKLLQLYGWPRVFGLQLPAVDHITLAYVAGAWWLARK